MVQLTLRAFPASRRLKEEAGLPWAAVVAPWTRALWRNDAHAVSDADVARHALRARDIDAAEIARCPACGGLINATCIVQRRHWQCSLCAEWIPLEGERYTGGGGSGGGRGGGGGRATLAELQRSWGEFFVARGVPRRDIIAHVIVVDMTRQAARGGYLGAARRGLRRAVESLPDNAWVALMGVEARRIKVCDLAASTCVPHFLCTAIVMQERTTSDNDDGKVLVPLADLLHMRQLAVRVGDHREAILNTINALCGGDTSAEVNTEEKRAARQKSPSRSTQADNEYRSNGSGGDDDGGGADIKAALAALLVYLARPAPDPAIARKGDPSLNQTIVAARISVVALSGINRSGASASPVPTNLVQFAAMSGVCVDVYVPGVALSHSCAATMFSSLVCKSGGRFRVCASMQCLENDLARHVGVSYAAAGMLSVRTSGGYNALTKDLGLSGLDPGLVARAEAEGPSSFHGEGVRGLQFHGMHLAGCDASTSVALSFQTDSSGLAVQPFSTSSELKRPVLQICYEFFQQEDDYVVRRLRVVTMLVPIAQNVHSLMLRADSRASFLVVCRKVLSTREAEQSGVGNSREADDEGRVGARLLVDWLIYLVTQYQVHVVRELSSGGGGGAVSTGAAAVDIFMRTKAGQRLAPLVQLVFGLLQLGALGGSNSVARKERATALRAMLSGLSCIELERAVYPRVIVYDSAARLVRSVELPRNAGMGEAGLRPLTAKPYEVLWTSGSTVMLDSFFSVTAFVGSKGIRGLSQGSEASKRAVLDPDSTLAAQLERRSETTVQCPDIRWDFSANVVSFRAMFVDDKAMAFGGLGGDAKEEMTFTKFVAHVKHGVHGK